MTIKEFIFHTCIPFCAKPICLLLVMGQMGIMDYYLINHTSKDIHESTIDRNTENVTTVTSSYDTQTVTSSYDTGGTHYAWYLWVVPDVAVIAVFIAAFVKSHMFFRKSTKEQNKQVGIGGELPLGYVAWFVFSVFAAIKVAIIYRWTAQLLPTGGLFGLNLLKMGVSMIGVVWVTLLMTHHDAKKGSARETFINVLQHSVTMDILDTSDILEVILIQESHVFLPFELHKAIIAVGCINIMLPTLLLFALSKSRFGKSEVWMKRLTVIHKVFYFLAINLPLLVFRVVLWSVHKQNVSVFIVKNCIGIGVAVRTIALQVESAVIASNAESADKNATEMSLINPAAGSDAPAAPNIEPAASTDKPAVVAAPARGRVDNSSV